MLQMWNNNMGTNFLPSWINCIDESMPKWINEYMCPGLMYVPRKPWKFSNKYHDAGCADSDIIWALDLREGKDCPQKDLESMTRWNYYILFCLFNYAFGTTGAVSPGRVFVHHVSNTKTISIYRINKHQKDHDYPVGEN